MLATRQQGGQPSKRKATSVEGDIGEGSAMHIATASEGDIDGGRAGGRQRAACGLVTALHMENDVKLCYRTHNESQFCWSSVIVAKTHRSVYFFLHNMAISKVFWPHCTTFLSSG